MTKKFDKLNETFNVSGEIVPVEQIESNVEKIEKISSTADDIKKDYEYARGNLYSLIEKGQEAINGILELAQESEMPRAYEVAGQLIKNVADATDNTVATTHVLGSDIKKITDADNLMIEIGDDFGFSGSTF